MLRNHYLYISCGLCLGLVGACNGDSDETPEDETEEAFHGGAFELVFDGRVGDEAFECGKAYEGIGTKGTMAMAQDLRFYVSNVRLITEEGDEVPVNFEDKSPWQTPQVALIDFENGTGACEMTGNTATNDRIAATVEDGHYVGVAFSISVPEELNHQDPTGAADPLQVTAMQWNWLLGYKFLRAEMMPMHHEAGMGGAHHEPEGVGGMGGSTSAPMHALDSQFHLGSLACTNDGDMMGPPAQSCGKPNRNEIRFSTFNPEGDRIVVDLAEMMKNIDLSTANHCHGMPHASCGPFYESIGLSYDSGEILQTQTAFRVEEQ